MTTNEGTNEITSGTMRDDAESADTLVVVSKVKKYVRETAGLNTSKDTIDALTTKVMQELRRGIENAKVAGRKTLMARDII